MLLLVFVVIVDQTMTHGYYTHRTVVGVQEAVGSFSRYARSILGF